MPTFDIFQQLDPIKVGEDELGAVWAANLIPCGSIDAPSGEVAIKEARKRSRFQIFNGFKLAGFPIVQERV